MEKTKTKGISRKWRFGTIAFVTTAVVVAVVILMNVVIDKIETRYPFTVDLTSEKTFTLSDESYTLARNLDNNTEVIVFLSESVFTADDFTPFKNDLYMMEQMYKTYFGEDVGGQYYNEFFDSFCTTLEQFYHMLQVFRAESNDKLTYTFIDLDKSPAQAAKYSDYEPETGEILFLSGERNKKISIVDLFESNMSEDMILEFNSKVERVVASKINFVSSANTKNAVILTGHGESEDVIAHLSTLLPLNGCEVTTLDITTNEVPADNTDVFIVPGPTTDYTVSEVDELRTWLNNDNKFEKDLLVVTNCFVASPLENLYQFLNDEYGIEVLNAIVYETDTGMQYAMSDYPPIENYGTIASTDYTSALAGRKVLMPASNALKLHFTDNKKYSEYSEALITSSETAGLMPMPMTGESSVYYSDTYPIVTAAYTTVGEFNNTDQQDYSTNVMVFGSVEFMEAERMNVSSAYNEEMFLSVFSGLTGLDTTLSISARTLTKDLLEFESRTPIVVLGHIFVWVIPAILVITALVVFIRRRRL